MSKPFASALIYICDIFLSKASFGAADSEQVEPFTVRYSKPSNTLFRFGFHKKELS